MSAPASSQNTGAAAIRDQAALRLMEKSLSENWSEVQQTDLENWLEQSLAHRTTYWRLEAAWDQTDRLAALRRPHAPSFAAQPVPARSALRDHLTHKPLRHRGHLARYAAMIVMLAVVGAGLLLHQAAPNYKTYATEIGGRQIITLEDGSQISLNTDSAIRINVTGTQRTIWLDRGEAYFDVRNGETQPFLVLVGDHQIRDIGTKFAVRRNADENLRLSVTEGKVELNNAHNAVKPVLITAGQQVSLNHKNITIEDKSIDSLTRDMSWRNGIIDFPFISLAEAASEFNRYNRTKIIVADDVTAKHSLAGSFATNDVDAFIRLSQRLFNLQVEHSGNQIILSQKYKSKN